MLEDQSNNQRAEISRLGDYVLLLESQVKSQANIIDDLKTECEKSKEEHNKLVELAHKHSELIHYTQQLETEKDGLIQDLAHRTEHSKVIQNQLNHIEEEHSKLVTLISEHQKELEISRKDGDSLRNEVNRLQGNREKLEEINVVLTTEISRYKELHEFERKEHGKLVETILALENEVNKLKTERQEFLEQRDQLAGQLHFIQSKLIYRVYSRIKKMIKPRLG